MAGYQVAGNAPGTGAASGGAGVGMLLADMNTVKQPLPTKMQTVDPAAINAGKVAARAQVQAADIVNSTLQDLSRQTGEATSSIQRQADADKEAERSRQQRDAEMAALAREKYGLTVGDLSDPSALGNQMAIKVRDIALQRQALGDKIQEQQSIDPTERPFDWIMAQFTTSGLVDQYNTMAAQQNGMQADSQAMLQMSENLVAAQKAGMPVHTMEENHAALSKIEEEAAQRKITAEMQLSVNRNEAAKSTASLLQNNYALVMGMDDRRRQVELSNLNQLQESVKWDATKQTRLYQELRAQSANAAELSVRRMEMAMGLQPGTGNALLDNKSIPQEQRDLLLRYAFTGSIDSPEQAIAISRYANRQTLSNGETVALPEIVKISDMIVSGQQQFYTAAAEGRIMGDRSLTRESWKNMSEAERSLAFNKHMRKFVQEAVADEAFKLSPKQLRDQHGVDVERIFPELTLYTNGNVAASPEDVFRAFVSSSGGNLRSAAVKIANYERLKLEKTGKNLPLEQAGVEMPKNQRYTTVYHGLFMGDTPISVDLTSPAQVENYLRKANLTGGK